MLMVREVLPTVFYKAQFLTHLEPKFVLIHLELLYCLSVGSLVLNIATVAPCSLPDNGFLTR